MNICEQCAAFGEMKLAMNIRGEHPCQKCGAVVRLYRVETRKPAADAGDCFAGVVLVKNSDGLVLAVSNRGYGGFSLPGGKGEAGETPKMTASRETYEEVGIFPTGFDLELVAQGPSCVEPQRMVFLFHARMVLVTSFSKEPYAREAGSEVRWFTFDELCEQSKFSDFYREHLPHGVDHLGVTVIRAV